MRDEHLSVASGDKLRTEEESSTGCVDLPGQDRGQSLSLCQFEGEGQIKRRFRLPVHASQRVGRERRLRDPHHGRLREIDPESFRRRTSQHFIGGLEVCYQNRGAFVQDSLGHQRTGRADSRRPHRHVAHRQGSKQDERRCTAHECIPPCEETPVSGPGACRRIRNRGRRCWSGRFIRSDRPLRRAVCRRGLRRLAFGSRPGTRCSGSPTPNPLLYERRSQHDRQTEQQQNQSKRGHPIGKTEVVREDVYHLQHDPRGGQVKAQHLPQRASMDFVDQFQHRTPIGSTCPASRPGTSGCSPTPGRPLPARCGCGGIRGWRRDRSRT